MVTYKVLLVGGTKVGKTSFIRAVKGMNIEEHKPTIGVDVHPVQIENNVYELWDCGGNDRYGGIRDGYYINADIALIFFDRNDKEGLKLIREYTNDIRRVVGDIKILTVGNKFDLNQYRCERKLIGDCVNISCKDGFQVTKLLKTTISLLLFGNRDGEVHIPNNEINTSPVSIGGSISEHLCVELFLYVPSETVLNLIEKQENTLSLLEDLPDTARKLLFNTNWYAVPPKQSIKVAMEEGIHPSVITDIFGEKKEIYQLIAEYSALYGRRDIVDLALTKYDLDTIRIAKKAATNGQKDITYEMIFKSKGDIVEISSDVVTYAAKSGILQFVKDLICDCFEGDTWELLNNAARYNHRNIIKFVLEGNLNINNDVVYDPIIIGAFTCNHIELMKDYIVPGKFDMMTVLQLVPLQSIGEVTRIIKNTLDN